MNHVRLGPRTAARRTLLVLCLLPFAGLVAAPTASAAAPVAPVEATWSARGTGPVRVTPGPGAALFMAYGYCEAIAGEQMLPVPEDFVPRCMRGELP